MKKFTWLVGFFLTLCAVEAQTQYADSLKKALQGAGEDISKVRILSELSEYYSFLYPDSALYYADSVIGLSIKTNSRYGEALGYICKAEALDRVADYAPALKLTFLSLELAKKLTVHKPYMISRAYAMLGHLNSITEKPKAGADYFHTSIHWANQSGEHLENLYYTYFRLAITQLWLNKTDSSLFYMQKGREHLETVKILRDPTPWLIMGNIYNTIGELGKSEISFREGIKLSGEFNALFIRAVLYNALAGIFYQRNTLDSAIYYASQSLLLSRKNNYKLFEKYSAGTLAFIYDTISADSALKYMKIMSAANDEAFSQAKVREFQNVGLDDERRQRELEKESIRLRNKIRLYALLAALFVFFVIALIFWRNSKQKHRANILLRTQKERAENTLIDLKATQAQLIQSEKMASLGELTAGIAHEIQNPLNFVNNFSELNTELIEEMKNEIGKGDIEEIKAITNILEKNEQKINHHGKRADAIVKGMLQHSRASTGKKESTNLNALADEYLRLAYHGLRAKDKDFNTTMKTDFDEGIGNINIIPQDIGRVLLNLYNNAFYAVTEKKKREDDYYEPTVTLSTKRLASHSGDGGKVEIKVADNGNGIPQNVIDKIFQPFFTTKPTGQGTGLGLSLSYDIIKAHGGEIKVETKEGEGSEFLIFLSIT